MKPASAITNGIWQQLDALAAHGGPEGHQAADAIIEAAAHWRIAHGADHADVAEHLQSTADVVHAAHAIARAV